jgi:hypothetical protein
MIFLIDHNIEGQALMLFGSLSAGGWLDILPIRFVSFDEAQLPIESSDRLVWRFAQEKQMILLRYYRGRQEAPALEPQLENCSLSSTATNQRKGLRPPRSLPFSGSKSVGVESPTDFLLLPPASCLLPLLPTSRMLTLFIRGLRG